MVKSGQLDAKLITQAGIVKLYKFVNFSDVFSVGPATALHDLPACDLLHGNLGLSGILPKIQLSAGSLKFYQ